MTSAAFLISQQEKPAEFDAISIRQIETTSTVRTANGVGTITTAHKPCTYSPSRVVCQLPLQELIQEAYKLSKTDMAGIAHIRNELFVVQAAMPPGIDKDAARLMLRRSLEERFGLVFHYEERSVPIYAMVAGKNGAKLQPADASGHRSLPKNIDSSLPPGGSLGISSGQFSAVALSLDSLADILNSVAGVERPVVNLTGLHDEYKMDLHWTPRGESATSFRLLDAGFIDAVQSQLGLRLEKRDVPSRVFIADHVNPLPTEN